MDITNSPTLQPQDDSSASGGLVQAATATAPPPDPTPAPTPAPAAAPAKPSVWKSIVAGALNGLANSGGATSFGAGLGRGAAGELNQQQVARENDLAQRRQANADQAQQNANQRTAVDVAHTQAMIVQTQRATMNMPENHQQAVIEGRADQTEQMRKIGAMVPIGDEDASSDHHVALQQVAALTQQNPGKLYSAEPVKGPDGKIVFQAMQVADAPLSEDVPLLDLDGKKVGVIPKGTQATKAAQLQLMTLQQGVSDLGAKAASDRIKANAAMVKAGAAAKTAASKDNPAALTPDALGFQPKMPVTGAQGYQKIASSFKKNADDLAQTEQTYQQFNDILKDAANGKDLTGAQSVVGLFNAIGISAEPLKGKGFRINNLTVAEHAGARGIQQAIEQKFGKLRTGEIITPAQLQDYAKIAEQVRESKYVGLVNQAHNVGLNADPFMPTGNGQKADPSTARIFLRLVGWQSGAPTPQQKQAAQSAMQKKGWSF